jgi:hypothetical protein
MTIRSPHGALPRYLPTVFFCLLASFPYRQTTLACVAIIMCFFLSSVLFVCRHFSSPATEEFPWMRQEPLRRKPLRDMDSFRPVLPLESRTFYVWNRPTCIQTESYAVHSVSVDSPTSSARHDDVGALIKLPNLECTNEWIFDRHVIRQPGRSDRCRDPAKPQGPCRNLANSFIKVHVRCSAATHEVHRTGSSTG